MIRRPLTGESTEIAEEMEMSKERASLDLGIANTFVQWTQSPASGLIVA